MTAALNVYRYALFTSAGCSSVSSVADSPQPPGNIMVSYRGKNIYVDGIKSSCRIQIFDMSGRMILNEDCYNGYYSFNFPAGIYVYHIFEKAGTNSRTGKLTNF